MSCVPAGVVHVTCPCGLPAVCVTFWQRVPPIMTLARLAPKLAPLIVIRVLPGRGLQAAANTQVRTTQAVDEGQKKSQVALARLTAHCSPVGGVRERGGRGAARNRSDRGDGVAEERIALGVQGGARLHHDVQLRAHRRRELARQTRRLQEHGRRQ